MGNPFVKDVLVSSEGGYHTYRIPTVITSKKGTIILCCEGRRHTSRDYGDVDLLIKRSFDRGETWEDHRIVHSEKGEVTIGNPVPILNRINGRIHLIFCRATSGDDARQVFHTTSRDDGQTFAEPSEISHVFNGFDFPCGFQWDGSHIHTGPVHGIQLSSGRLIAPVKFANFADQSKRFGPLRRVGIIYSDDDGETWKPGGVVPPAIGELSESTVYECADGSICLNMRWQDGLTRAVSRSNDQGATWTEPVPDENLPDPVCQGSALRIFSKDKNNVLLFTNLPERNKKVGGDFLFPKRRRRLTIRMSRDDGRTWDFSKVIYNGPSGYSDLTVAEDGSILVLYENGKENHKEKISLARFPLEWIESED